MRDFFSSHIRNANTRRAYREAVRQFSGFCAEHGIVDLAQVEPVHVAAFVGAQLKQNSKPTVKQRPTAPRMLFDWMVVGQVLPVNPAHAVPGPKHTQRRGKTPVLQADEARALLDAIDTDSLPGLRDRAPPIIDCPLRFDCSLKKALDRAYGGVLRRDGSLHAGRDREDACTADAGATDAEH